MRAFLFSAALLVQGAESAHLAKSEGQKFAAISVHAAGAKKNPGSGMDPSKLEPFKKAMKDDYFPVECVADFMYKHGDKFGDNSEEYKLGGVSDVSIAHYDAHVLKDDREQMTHDVCFEFCRTLANMTYFGITKGRECYCMAFYEAMSDDSSICDVVCDGDQSTMCGGTTKSNIFGMHSCGSTATDLTGSKGALSQSSTTLTTLEGKVSTASKNMQSAAAAWQTLLDTAGASGASKLMLSAKVFAGDLEKAAGAAKEITSGVGKLESDADGMSGSDFKDSATLKKAEKLLSGMDKTAAKADEAAEGLNKLLAEAAPDAKGSKNASKAYYSIMYFVDKEFESLPSTCSGEVSKKPLLGSMDACAQACDADVQNCVGFSYFPAAGELTKGGLCFLMSKFTTVKYWAGCAKKTLFLQHSAATAPKVDASAVKCVAKLSQFEGISLKPDKSGKCSLCLNEAEKADRCVA